MRLSAYLMRRSDIGDGHEPSRALYVSPVHDLHEVEIELLLALADFAETHDEPMTRQALFDGSNLENAEFFRRLRYLIEIGLVCGDRDRPLAEPGHLLSLTGEGTWRVVAERVVARKLPRPGPRSRLSPLAADD